MKNLNRKKLYIIYKEKGITLIALIITIIIVLILAGVSVAVLSNSGIIKKSKLAGETYQSKINEEEKAMQNYDTTMNEYTIADTGRDTITISKEEYENLKLMNKPNLWEVGKEYDFGDGIYGQRFTGTITSDANIHTQVIIDSNGSNYRVITCGGYLDRGDGVLLSAFSNDNNSVGSTIAIRSNGMYFESKERTFSRSNSPYDIWVLYTKN